MYGVLVVFLYFFFKQKTAFERRISDWSSDVCSSDLIRDLSAHVADIDGAAIGPEGLAKLAGLDPASLPLVEGEVRYGPCVAGTRHSVPHGLNHADHAAASNQPLPTVPVPFHKRVRYIPRPNAPVTNTKDSQKTR